MDYSSIFFTNFYTSFGYSLGVVSATAVSIPAVAYYLPSVKRIFMDSE